MTSNKKIFSKTIPRITLFSRQLLIISCILSISGCSNSTDRKVMKAGLTPDVAITTPQVSSNTAAVTPSTSPNTVTITPTPNPNLAVTAPTITPEARTLPNEVQGLSTAPPLPIQLPSVVPLPSNGQVATESPLGMAILGEHSTSFNPKSKARATNIKKSADSINNVLLMPGEVFSYNQTVGPTSKKRGYLMARIFIKGKDSKGYGGGVCQTSSTLYNAVLNAGLEVVERHPHSKSVQYVEKDKDAATDYGGIDFKFKNSLNYPIKIVSIVENGTVKISILGIQQ